MYKLSTPFILFENGLDGYSIVSFGIWLLSFAAWWAFLVGLLQIFFGEPTASNTNTSLRWFDYINVGIYFLSILLIPVAYARTCYFLLNKNTVWKTRIIVLVLLVFFFSLILWSIATEYPGIYGRIQNTPYLRNIFLMIFFLFLVPAGFYAVSLLMIVFRFVIWLINYLFQSFIASYSPNRIKAVRRIIDEPIAMDDVTWRLTDMSVLEIRSIREWARDNLDATEKRTVPAFWLMALLGLIANTTFFENWLSNVSNYFSLKYSEIQDQGSIFAVHLDTLLIFMLGIPIVIGLLLLIVSMFMALFRNISIQSAIIESCTVVLYAKEKIIQDTQVPKKRSWLERILG